MVRKEQVIPTYLLLSQAPAHQHKYLPGPQLKMVATASAGFNHCNLDELRARGIKLANTPNVLSPAVAEIAVALILGTARRFTENLDQVRR